MKGKKMQGEKESIRRKRNRWEKKEQANCEDK